MTPDVFLLGGTATVLTAVVGMVLGWWLRHAETVARRAKVEALLATPPRRVSAGGRVWPETCPSRHAGRRCLEEPGHVGLHASKGQSWWVNAMSEAVEFESPSPPPPMSLAQKKGLLIANRSIRHAADAARVAGDDLVEVFLGEGMAGK